MNRRQVLRTLGGAVGVGVLAPGLLAACAAPAPTSSGSTPATGATAASNAAPASATSAPSAAQPVSFWYTSKGGPGYDPTYQQLADQFNAAQHDYTVSIKTVPTNSNSSVIETVTTAVASGTQPDALCASAYLPWQFTAQNQVAPLDDVISQLQASGQANDFVPGVLDVFKYQGHYMGVPTAYDIMVPFYRKDIFDKYGIQPPTTWDDLMTAGATLQKQGVYLFAQGSAQTGWQQMMCYLFNNGGGWYDDKGNVTAANDPRNLEALTFVSELVKRKYISPSSAGMSDDDITRMFAGDQAAIMYYHPGFPAQLSQLGSNIQVLSPYTAPHGDKGTTYWVNNALVFSKAQNPTGGKAWLQWLIMNNGPLYWQGLARQAPVRKSDAANPYFANDVSQTIVQDWIPVGKTMGTHDAELFPQLATLESGTMLPNMVNSILQGDDPAQVLQTTQSAIQTMMQG